MIAHFHLFLLSAKMKKSVFVSTLPRAPLAHNKFYTLSEGYIKMIIPLNLKSKLSYANIISS
jgi:hypothetical protein